MNQDPSKASPEAAAVFPGTYRPSFWIVVAAAAFIAAAVFAVTLRTETFLKDPESVLHLSLLSHGKHVPRIFGQEFMSFTGGRYRPLPYALLALVRTFVAADDLLFWNVWLLVFHVLNALLVYGVARRFTKRSEGALLALGVFLLHPVASAFGNQINLFPYVLGGSFYLGSLLCYLHYARSRRAAWYVVGLLLFACGLLSSHAVLTLLLLIVLYEIFYERTGVFRIIRRLLPFGLVALLLGYCYLTFHPHLVFYEYPPPPPAKALRYWTYSFAAGGADAVFALARGWPMSVPVSGLVGGMYKTWNLAAVALVLLLWLATSVRGLLKKRWLAVGTFLLLLSVLPRFSSTENLTPDYGSWTYRYLPLMGFALLVGALVDRLLEAHSRRLRQLTVAAASVLVVLYGGLLVVANVRSRTPESYWRYVLEKDPESEIACAKLGKIYLDRDNEEEAKKYLFSRVLRAIRRSSLALARYYTRKGDLLAAAIHLQVAYREVEFGLKHRELPLIAAEMMCNARAFDFAEQHLGNVLSADPYNTTALKRLGEILAVKGYLPAAVGYLRAVSEIDPGDTENARRLEVIERRLNYPESFPVPEKMTPPDRGWLGYAMREPAEKKTRDDIVRLADARPDDPVIQLVASIFLSERGLHKRALETVDRALAILPVYPFARTTKSYVAYNAGKVALAVKTLEEMPDVTPRDARSLLYFATTRLRAKEYPTAIAATCAALRGDPNKPQTHGVLAGLLVREGRFGEALFHYTRALDQPRKKLGHVHNGLGYVLMRLGELDKAIVHYRESIAIDPKQPRVYRNLTTALMHKGWFGKAIGALEEALKAIPDDASFQCDLALLLACAPRAELRNGERAVRLAEAVSRKTKPMTAQVLDVLAAAYAETGRFDTAVETAAQAARLARSRSNQKLAQSIERRVRLYRDHRPFRMSPPGSPPSPDE